MLPISIWNLVLNVQASELCSGLLQPWGYRAFVSNDDFKLLNVACIECFGWGCVLFIVLYFQGLSVHITFYINLI